LEYKDAVQYLELWDYTLEPASDLFPDLAFGNRKELLSVKYPPQLDDEFPFSQASNLYLLKLLDTMAPKGLKTGTKAALEFSKHLMDSAAPICKDRAGVPSHVTYEQLQSVIRTIEDSAADVPHRLDEKVEAFIECDRYSSKCLTIGHMLSRIKSLSRMHSTRRIMQRNLDEEFHVYNESKKRFEKTTKTVKRADYMSIKLNRLRTEKAFEEFPYTVYNFGSVYFFSERDAEEDSEFPCYVLTAKDLARMKYYIEAIGSLRAYGEYLSCVENDGTLKDAVPTFRTLYEKTKNPDRFVEAWVHADAVHKVLLAGPLAKASLPNFILEHKQKGFEALVPIEAYMERIAHLDVQQQRTYKSVIRAAMPPDYDLPGIFSAERDLHRNKNPCGLEIDEEHEEIYNAYWSYRNKKYIEHSYRLNGVYPGKVDMPETAAQKKYNQCVEDRTQMSITLELADSVNLTGTAKYVRRDNTVELHFKDGGVMPETLHPSTANRNSKNQILHMITATERLDVESFRQKIQDSSVRHYTQVGLKNESAKEQGRLYFNNPFSTKIILSEVEANVAPYLAVAPGNAVGKPSGLIKRTVTSAMKPSLKADTAPALSNDDFSKWSPWMNVRFQRDDAEWWADKFGEDWLRHIENINLNDLVVLDQDGYHASYCSHGSDKEGQKGKRMSYAMTVLRGFGMFRARGYWLTSKEEAAGVSRRRDPIVYGSSYALIFLDDGFSGSQVRRKDYGKNAKELYRILQQTNAALGFLNKPHKMYPSHRYATFCNLEFYKGMRVYDGAKSVTRRYIRDGATVQDANEVIRERSSWASGASESGVCPWFAYFAMVVDSIKAIEKLANVDLPRGESAGPFLVTPIAYGGLGMPHRHAVAGSLLRDGLAEGIYAIERAVEYKKIGEKYSRHILRAEVLGRTPLAVLRAPRTTTTTYTIMNKQHLTRAVESKLASGEPSIYLQHVIPFGDRAALENFAKHIFDVNPAITLTQIEDMYKSSPLAVYDRVVSKCKKSATLVHLLGEKAKRRVLKSNAADIQKAVRQWQMLFG